MDQVTSSMVVQARAKCSTDALFSDLEERRKEFRKRGLKVLGAS